MGLILFAYLVKNAGSGCICSSSPPHINRQRHNPLGAYIHHDAGAVRKLQPPIQLQPKKRHQAATIIDDVSRNLSPSVVFGQPWPKQLVAELFHHHGIPWAHRGKYIYCLLRLNGRVVRRQGLHFHLKAANVREVMVIPDIPSGCNRPA